ncbi:MAG: NAD(P)/FAD-dependent oxidoreductase [Planctomycetaceae bacterium]|nr:NAD(P)/FAD-dependent oxidoreductase [Planctomycetaceae bacterium]
MPSIPYDVAILGGGPAGLACAVGAGKRRLSVLLLEKNAQPGRKLLISGTGQCNLTHAGRIENFLDRYGSREKGRFVKPALYHFTNADWCGFFRENGVALEETATGKIFPASRRASEILNLFLALCKQYGVIIQTGSPVESVEKVNDLFTIRTPQSVATARNLVIATGGCSYPATGSSGNGWRLAASLGHTIVSPKPGLTPVYWNVNDFVECSGVSVDDVGIRIGKTKHTARGSVLFTHKGVSGPLILDFSRNMNPGDTLVFNWLGDTKAETLGGVLLDTFARHGRKSIKGALRFTGLPERLLVALLKATGISPETPACEISRTDRGKIATMLTTFEAKIAALGGFHEAMVTVGGVSLREVDRNSMESRLVKRLYFCGEVLDIDGDTGGYNIQFAVSSGFLAADKIAGTF